jgi:hypothetical protein
MSEPLEAINENFNYELWRYVKIYAFSVESVNIARMYCGTGIEVDKSIAREEVKTELYLKDEVLFQKIIRPFCPKDDPITIGEFYQTLSPQNSQNMYSLMSENFLIELISIFEKYLQGLLGALLVRMPELALSKEKKINASDLLNFNHIDDLRNSLIDEKVRQMMYKSIQNIVGFLSRGFRVKLDFDDTIFQTIYYWKEVRNLLIHNRGVVNEGFLESVKKMGVDKEFSIGHRIKYSIYDVVDFAVELRTVANEIYTKITDEKPKELTNDPFQVPSETELQNTILHKSRNKIGRNDPCPCGSGLKYKKCCSKIHPFTGERV